MNTIPIGKKKQALIRQLPDEMKQRLLDGQIATLQQLVYEIATQKCITIWAVDLCKADTDYVFANEVRQLQSTVQP